MQLIHGGEEGDYERNDRRAKAGDAVRLPFLWSTATGDGLTAALEFRQHLAKEMILITAEGQIMPNAFPVLLAAELIEG